MNYGIKDIQLTLHGEGAHAGVKVVQVRFSDCNLWDGHPLHRSDGEGACARWCDADFFKGKAVDVDTILAQMDALWPGNGERRCVLTGGEPCSSIDQGLMEALKDSGWTVAVETNGTEHNGAVEAHADWICISPKLDSKGTPLPIVLRRADEIKVVLPGDEPGKPGWTAAMLQNLEDEWPEVHLCVMPQDPLFHPDLVGESALVRTSRSADLIEDEREEELHAQLTKNVARCVKHVMAHPAWALSFQMQKAIGVP